MAAHQTNLFLPHQFFAHHHMPPPSPPRTLYAQPAITVRRRETHSYDSARNVSAVPPAYRFPLLPHMMFDLPIMTGQQDSRSADMPSTPILKTRKPCPEDKEEDKVCAVCLDDLIVTYDDKIGILDCRHEFHAACITKWLRKKNLCPLCRAIALGPR